MAGSKKFSCEFEGLDELIKRISELEGNVKAVTDKALKETRDAITPGIEAAMAKHKRTGRTAQSIRKDLPVEWVGDQAAIPVGFDISNGGLPSVFLMYGTPRMKKDTALYNSIYGKKVIQQARELQAEIIYDELRKLEG